MRRCWRGGTAPESSVPTGALPLPPLLPTPAIAGSLPPQTWHRQHSCVHHRSALRESKRHCSVCDTCDTALLGRRHEALAATCKQKDAACLKATLKAWRSSAQYAQRIRCVLQAFLRLYCRLTAATVFFSLRSCVVTIETSEDRLIRCQNHTALSLSYWVSALQRDRLRRHCSATQCAAVSHTPRLEAVCGSAAAEPRVESPGRSLARTAHRQPLVFSLAAGVPGASACVCALLQAVVMQLSRLCSLE